MCGKKKTLSNTVKKYPVNQRNVYADLWRVRGSTLMIDCQTALTAARRHRLSVLKKHATFQVRALFATLAL